MGNMGMNYIYLVLAFFYNFLVLIILNFPSVMGGVHKGFALHRDGWIYPPSFLKGPSKFFFNDKKTRVKGGLCS